MSILTKLFGNPNIRLVKSVQPLVDKINELEKDISQLTSEELKQKTFEFRARLSQGETLEDLLPEAFAVVREAAKRTIGQRHFDVQLIGGIFLHRGYIAEMRTGEGKTLTATSAVYLNALSGQGVHLVTVNDYLAKRDAVWMGKIYHALGLTVSCIQQQMISYIYEPGYQGQETRVANLSNEKAGQELEKKEENTLGALVKVEPSHLRPCERREAYACDILYGTNNEFGFDYLRDNMATRLEDMVQSRHSDGEDVSTSSRELNYAIVDEVDSILIDEARTPLIISAPAEEATEKYYKFAETVNHLKENEDYNIDEKLRTATFTEAGIERLEKMLNLTNIYAEGGVGTVHHLEQALKAKALFKIDRDYVVKDGEIIIVDEFTGRLMFGRRYSEGLHQAIEAKEGVKIQRESQTLATITFQNYFRLYKKLAGMTGTAATEAEEFAKIYNLEVMEIPTHRPMVRRDLSDRIYKNEHGKFTAVIREIKEKHEKGQPVLVGTISIEKNELLSQMLEMEGIPHQILNAKNHEKEAEIISQAGRLGAVTLATNMAGRGVDIILGGNTEAQKSKIRNQNLSAEAIQKELDELQKDWLAEREKVMSAGGLHVLGTERHESRRIDNQLRGRSGRQGDPGSSQFYVSLEDDLMRIFGSDRIKGMMEFLKIPEDMPIENRMVSRSLESAQKKVEGHNFDIRKHLLEYDDVLNKQRTVIYQKRREILEEYEREKKFGARDVIPTDSDALVGGVEGSIDSSTALHSTRNDNDTTALRQRILTMVENEIEQFVFFHTGGTEAVNWNLQEVCETAVTIFTLTEENKKEILKIGERGEGRLSEAEARSRIIEFLVKISHERYEELEKKINNKELMLEVEKSLSLRSIDMLWVEHLVAIDYLRVGIGLRGYGQRDPLVEYKKETYRLFNELLSLIQKEVVYAIYKVNIGIEVASSLMERQGLQMSGAAKDTSNSSQGVVKKKEFSEDAGGHKVGRNEPCPCGAKREDGRPIKYKHCHGRNV